MPSAILYLRVSSQMQAAKQNPIATQQEACLTYAKQHSYDVDLETGIYKDDGISGRTDERADFQRMMERIKTDPAIEAIIAYDISRIFRNGVEYFMFKGEIEQYGKKFLSVSETLSQDKNPANWMMEWILAGFAEFRSRQDAEKIKLGMLHKAESGIFPAKAPYGYKNMQDEISGGKSRRWMEPDEHEAPWVKKAFQMYASGNYGLYDLVQTLHTEGFPTENGKPLVIGTIEKILKSKLYIGHISWGGIENPNGKHEKLIDEETFYKVQAILQARNLGSNKKRKYTFLLRGLASCGDCGSRITAGNHKNRRGIIYPYYYCQRKIGVKRVSCNESALSVGDAERQFDDLMKAVQISERTATKLKDRIKASAEKYQGNNKELRESLIAKLKEIDGRKKSLTEKFIDEDIDKDTYHKHKEELETNEVKCRAELSKIEGYLSSWKTTTEEAIELAKSCYKAYREATYDQKILLANTIFDKIVIKDRKIVSVKLKEPFEYLCKRKTRRDERFGVNQTTSA